MQSLEALAEISDFVAGLVQRVPKKPSEVKADLQNSTVRLWKQDASATKDLISKVPLIANSEHSSDLSNRILNHKPSPS